MISVLGTNDVEVEQKGNGTHSDIYHTELLTHTQHDWTYVNNDVESSSETFSEDI